MKNLFLIINEIFYELISYHIDIIDNKNTNKKIIDNTKYRNKNSNDIIDKVFIETFININLSYSELIYVLILYEYVIKNYNVKNFMRYVIPAIISISLKILSDEPLYLKDIANNFNINFKKLYDIEFILYENIFLIDNFKITNKIYYNYDNTFITTCNILFTEYNALKIISKYKNNYKNKFTSYKRIIM